MNITVTGRNIAVTDALRDYATEKLEAATNVFDIPMDLEVILRVEKNPSNPVPDVVEVTAFLKGAVVRVSEAATDMYAAIDLAADRVSRQLRKYKTKVVDRRQRAGAHAPAPTVAPLPTVDEINPDSQAPADDDDDLLVREKLIEFTRLTEDQALLQVDLLGHDFFVFTNADTGDVNVIYHRKDGGYGIIKPLKPAPALGDQD
ncbi:MAG: ribosome-associated translation inhibitor RaiA [Coriobacteriales bacterium]|jgi:putative sigma-54 modulation protein